MDGAPWLVGIRHPRQSGGVIATVELSIGALATSGDYERFFEVDDCRYCHILNARTGRPVRHWRSISVVAPLCVVAGSCSTIAMLLEEAARKFLDSQGVRYLGVTQDGALIGRSLQRLDADQALAVYHSSEPGDCLASRQDPSEIRRRRLRSRHAASATRRPHRDVVRALTAIHRIRLRRAGIANPIVSRTSTSRRSCAPIAVASSPAAAIPMGARSVVIAARFPGPVVVRLLLRGALAPVFALAGALLLAAMPARADDEPAPRYHVEIDAPASVKGAVERSLDLVRWQNYAGLTPELLELLIADAKVQAVAASESQGYFAAVVSGKLDESATPPTVRIRVEPGEPTLVVEVSIATTGAVTDADRGADAISAIRAKWLLPPGSIFRQADWAAAKAAAVQTLSANRYAAAKISSSEADIDPDTRAARLHLTVDSGPPFRFGALEISGLEKYADTTVRNLATFAAGDWYSIEALNTFVRRLNATGYFASAQATVAPDPANAESAPVKVTLIEAPSKKFSGGIGFATDVLYLAQLSFDNVNLDGRGLQFRSDLRVDSKQQNATVKFTLPPKTPSYTDSFTAKLDHTDISGMTTKDIAVGWTRQTADVRDQTTYSAFYYVSRQEPPFGVLERSHALYGEVGHAWRRVDDLLAPTQGYALNVQAGGGPPSLSTRAFGRSIAQLAWWIPFDTKTQLALRAEGGAVLASSADGIPAPLLFRTGGDTTVRGYAFQSLGPRIADATVGGRYYALASAEVVRWIGPSWGIAVFADAGNAADRVRDLRPAYGYGVGGRLRTPIGPFRLDLAYGERAKTFRIHLSVGLSF